MKIYKSMVRSRLGVLNGSPVKDTEKYSREGRPSLEDTIDIKFPILAEKRL